MDLQEYRVWYAFYYGGGASESDCEDHRYRFYLYLKAFHDAWEHYLLMLKFQAIRKDQGMESLEQACAMIEESRKRMLDLWEIVLFCHEKYCHLLSECGKMEELEIQKQFFPKFEAMGNVISQAVLQGVG